MANFYVNDRLAYRTPIDRRGHIMGLVFNFTGEGVVDYIRMKDLESSAIYMDQF